MKKYVKYIIFVVAIAVGFVGIRALYNKLSQSYQPDSGLVVENSSQAQVQDATGGESTEQTTTQTQSQQGTEDTTETDDAKAIDFTVEDVDGNKISLYSKVGKPIVVNFWASWCSPCKSELPDFQLAFENFGEDIEFMMVNLTDGRSETVEGASGFVSAQGYTFPVYFDVDQEAAYAYYVTSIPTTYFIDADGNVVAYAQGMIDYNTLLQGIEMIK